MSVATLTAQGRLTADVTLTDSTANKALADFDIAINHRRRTGEGREDAPTTFLSVRATGRLAENLATLTKGQAVIVVGDLVTDEWTARDSGEKRRKNKLLATAAGPDYTAPLPAA